MRMVVLQRFVFVVLCLVIRSRAQEVASTRPPSPAAECPQKGAMALRFMQKETLGGKTLQTEKEAVEGQDVHKRDEQFRDGGANGVTPMLQYIETIAMGAANMSNCTELVMSVEVQEAIASVREFAANLTVGIRTHHSRQQREINDAVNLITDCANKTDGSDGQPEVKTSLSNMEQLRATHSTCRVEEITMKDRKEARCNDFEVARKSEQFAKPPACSLSGVSTDDEQVLKSFKTCWDKVHAWNSGLRPLYEACNNSSELHRRKREDCGLNQSSFEASFCDSSTKSESYCSCRQRAVDFFNKFRKDVEADEADRKANYEAVLKIKCLFNVLKANRSNANSTTCQNRTEMVHKCTHMQVNTSWLSIKYTTVPDSIVHCLSTGVVKPCDDAWLSKEYTSKNWYGKAPTKTCTACPNPVATSTSTTSATTSVTTAKTVNLEALKDTGEFLAGFQNGAGVGTWRAHLGEFLPGGGFKQKSSCIWGLTKSGWAKAGLSDWTGSWEVRVGHQWTRSWEIPRKQRWFKRYLDYKIGFDEYKASDSGFTWATGRPRLLFKYPADTITFDVIPSEFKTDSRSYFRSKCIWCSDPPVSTYWLISKKHGSNIVEIKLFTATESELLFSGQVRVEGSWQGRVPLTFYNEAAHHGDFIFESKYDGVRVLKG